MIGSINPQRPQFGQAIATQRPIQTPKFAAAGSNVVTLTTQNFDQEVLNSTIPVLVDFYADWCAPCRAMAPLLEVMAGLPELQGKIKIAKLNIDENRDLLEQNDQSGQKKYPVQSIPNFWFFNNGQKTDNLIGANRGALIQKVAQLAGMKPEELTTKINGTSAKKPGITDLIKDIFKK